jgi:very-short-patch-repair endonuclease/methylase of polypeptide subunit release factors
VLQCVLAMFAEDRQLLPRSLFVRSVQDCLQGESAYDVIGGLFRAMNSRDVVPAGRFQGVDYFNGGLFAEIHPLELTPPELKFLEVSALEDWSKVRPAIFGNIFESAIDEQDRHAHGIHYTAEADIMKIVRPTISRYWEERIDQANTIKQLEALQIELRNYRVLDPACGSGNFLYIAYQELKQIEQDLLDKIAERRRTADLQMQMGYVTPLQFFGIDNNPFAVELARVTLMIARKVAIDRLGLYEPALPLDTLDQNIRCQDALFTEWPKADAIIGNPPFLGGKHMRIAIGDEYIDRVFRQFPAVKDSVDFCAYWFRLANDHLDENGRAGLVGTNSVSQGKSRLASLDYVIQNHGVIHEAISSQPWSGEANVHVSIVNWMKVLPSSPSPFSPGEKGDQRQEETLDVSRLAGIQRRIPEALLLKARELRKNQTSAEEILWQCLRDRRLGALKFRRQHNIGQFIADFYCHEARLVIEADGGIHTTQVEKDADRDRWMTANSFKVLRFNNEEILDNISAVLAKILETAQPELASPLAANSPLTPAPSPAGEEKQKPPSPRGRRAGDEGQRYLNNQPVPFINSALTAKTDVSSAARLKTNRNYCFQGVIPLGQGFLIDEASHFRENMIRREN